MEETQSLEYNSQRSTMHLPEYGRNVQKMVKLALSIEDREERNKVAQAIIRVMGELNPHLKVEEYKPKLWTHLFVMSDFQLDVDSPYPIPQKEKLSGKPGKVAYPQTRIKFGHYGKTVEKMIQMACDMEKGPERQALVKVTAGLMKKFHLTYNSNSIDDAVIGKHLNVLSEGRIELDDLSFLPSTQEVLKTTGGVKTSHSNKNRGNRNKNRNKNNKNRNRKRY
ncbi:MAG: DUF4290 domain-containing protein [Crocinitomicaceae bacterium]|nr:DUF4290 domain-containing protein [Crocinitomicaceae bacterium]